MTQSVLLVEDDEALLQGMEVLLVDGGFDVTALANGKDALHVLQKTQFDAIILDDNLPFIQGSDLLGLIRVHSPGVRIVVMSGLFNADGMRKIQDRGADLVLEKPFDVQRIIEFLQGA
jgi:DNA-binding response OmpR family regulator